MKTVRENIKPIIVLAILFWVFGMHSFVTIYQLVNPEAKNGLDPDLKSFMNMIAIMAIGYYIGASTGAAKKDETINNLIEKQK